MLVGTKRITKSHIALLAFANKNIFILKYHCGAQRQSFGWPPVHENGGCNRGRTRRRCRIATLEAELAAELDQAPGQDIRRLAPTNPAAEPEGVVSGKNRVGVEQVVEVERDPKASEVPIEILQQTEVHLRETFFKGPVRLEHRQGDVYP